MALIKFKNFAYSLLAGSITDTDTTVSVTAGHGVRFPALSAGDYFFVTLQNATLDREIVKVTARTGDNFTVTRGQDNTTARAWTAGAAVGLRLNAEAIETMLNAAEVFDGSVYVDVAGDTMAGPLEVPAGATGPQVPQAQEVLPVDAPVGSNVVINGRMWNAPDGVTSWTNPIAGTYVLGLWYVNRVGTFAVNLNQVTTGPASCPTALRLTCTTAVASPAASDVLTIEEILEGYDTTQYIGKTFTVRGSVFSDVAGVVPFYVRGSNRSYVFPITVVAGVNTAFEHTIVGGLDPTGTWGTGINAGARFGVCAMAGSGQQAPISAGWNASTYFGLAGQVNAVGAVNRKLEFTEVSWALGTAKPQAEDHLDDRRRMTYWYQHDVHWQGGCYLPVGTTLFATVPFPAMRANPAFSVLAISGFNSAGPGIFAIGKDNFVVSLSPTATGGTSGDVLYKLSARF